MTPLLLLCALAAAAPQAAVNPFEEPDESELFRLDEQLVTVASRYAQTLRKAPSIVSLVTADDIRTRGYRTLSDVLRDLPGIYVWKSKEGRDIATFRGVVSADNNKVLLLVDGVPWYDGVYTHAFLDDFLPLSNVKQVEVIKGPGSAVYGTNAFSGVVNVVTYDGGDINGASARWVAGGRARSDLTVSVGGRDEVNGIPVEAVAYGRILSQMGDGIDVTPRGRNDIQGYDQRRGLAVGARLQVADLRLQIHHVDYAHPFLINEANSPEGMLNKDIDNFGLYYHDTFFEGRYRWRQGVVTVSPHVWSQLHDNPGSYFFTRGYETRRLPGGGFETGQLVTTVETTKSTRRAGAGVDVEAHPGIDHISVGGLGFENTGVIRVDDVEYLDFSSTGQVTDFQAKNGLLTNFYAYGQHTWTALPELEIVAGGRLDVRLPPGRIDDVGGWTTKAVPSPRVAVLWVPSDTVTAKLLYGGAFRAPSVRELLVQAPYEEVDGIKVYEFSSGSLRVQPESIQTIEAEVSAKPQDDLEGSLSTSYSVLSQEIDKVNSPNEHHEQNVYTNLRGALGIFGVEAQVKWTYDMLEVSGAYSLTAARYGKSTENPYAERVQYEFPPHMLKGRVLAQVTDNLSANLLAEVYGPRPRAAWAPGLEVDDGKPFALMHLAVRTARLGKDGRVDMTASVRNLLDSKWGTGVYRDDVSVGRDGVARYPGEMEGEGRSVNVGLEIRL